MRQVHLDAIVLLVLEAGKFGSMFPGWWFAIILLTAAQIIYVSMIYRSFRGNKYYTLEKYLSGEQ